MLVPSRHECQAQGSCAPAASPDYAEGIRDSSPAAQCCLEGAWEGRQAPEATRGDHGVLASSRPGERRGGESNPWLAPTSSSRPLLLPSTPLRVFERNVSLRTLQVKRESGFGWNGCSPKHDPRGHPVDGRPWTTHPAGTSTLVLLGWLTCGRYFTCSRPQGVLTLGGKEPTPTDSRYWAVGSFHFLACLPLRRRRWGR